MLSLSRIRQLQGRQTTTPKIFEQQYLCSPFSAHQDKSHLENGNRIIMPVSALDSLTSLNIEHPMVFFSIKNAWRHKRVSHCGVLEFGSDEGFVLMPNWMISNLRTVEGQLVTLKSTSLPKGTYMKIQPHSTKFIQGLSNPKEILKGILLRDFSCITAGDTIAISYRGESHKIDILETKPSNAISLIETDFKVDFARPLDYKALPRRKTRCPKQVHSETNTKPVTTSTKPKKSGSGNMVFGHKENNNTTKEAIPLKKSQVADDTKLFKPLTGAGRSLQGTKY